MDKELNGNISCLSAFDINDKDLAAASTEKSPVKIKANNFNSNFKFTTNLGGINNH